MLEIVLVPVIETEIPALQTLAHATWEPTYQSILSQEQIQFMYEDIYSEESLREQMHNGQKFYFIQEAAENVGFLSVTDTNTAEGRFKLNKLYVLPQLHGQGLGRRAMEAAICLVEKHHGKIMELNVNRHNKAKDFYERCGFIITREEDIPIGEYWMNDYVMEKKLA
jgi:ribosomal protein S18 acetylase RimI-like enzyme